MILDFLFLPLVLFIGLITSYEDWRFGKVRNKWIIWGLVWGFAVLICWTLWYFVASPITRFYYFNILKNQVGSPAPVFTVSISYLLRSFLNALFALLTGFLIWRAGAWAAGDAKLFFVYSLLIPLTYYWKSFFYFFPSFVLLTNIFVPILAYFFVRSLFCSAQFLRFKVEKSKETAPASRIGLRINFKNIFLKTRDLILSMLKSVVVVMTIFLLFGLILQPIQKLIPFNISFLPIFVVAGMIIFAETIAKFLRRKRVVILFSLSFAVFLTVGLLISPESTLLLLGQSVRKTLFFMFLFILLRGLIGLYISRTGRKIIGIDELKSGANLTDETILMLRQDKSFWQRLGTLYSDGLSRDQAEMIKGWVQQREKNTASQTITIYKPFPFVPWMFVGVVITLLLKQSLLFWILRLF